MATAILERGRITTRVSASVQETLETAANMVGATVNQFVVQTALREAQRIIEQERVVRFSGKEAMCFLNALDTPLPPNQNLAAALLDYTTKRDDQTGIFNWTPRPKGI